MNGAFLHRAMGPKRGTQVAGERTGGIDRGRMGRKVLLKRLRHNEASAVSAIEPELAELEQADITVKAFLQRLRAEPDVERRRAFASST